MISIGSDELVFLGNDNASPVVQGLYNNLTQTYVNNATVNGTLYDYLQTTVITTFSLAYIAASNGNYQGSIPANITSTLVAEQNYWIKIVAVAGGLTQIFWQAHQANESIY